ncbi:MAG: hypothetical protein R3B90_01060 [Planctomycetaceae bacterium]
MRFVNVLIRPSAALIVGLALVASGCGGGGGDAPTVYEVKGKVTNGTTPLAGVQVNFVPAGDTGLPSAGVTDAEGMYVLKRHTGEEGAMPGSYVITLSMSTSTTSEAAYSAGGKPPEVDDSVIPEKWQNADTSPKKVEVKAEANTVDIDVSAE